jgi:predicted CXXCH cytochrome family protein
MADLPSAGDSLDSTLPYGGIASGAFECTTCHNVHDDTNMPFLQDDIDVLCARCHDNRQFVGGTASATQGDWGANYGSANDGSHPVGDDVYQDGGADSPITIAATFRTAYGATNGGHNLGGHLTNGETVAGANSAGGITCVTCHAVHGSRADANPPVVDDGTPAVNDLLVIAQSATGSIANGGAATDDNNALCEGCHISPAGTIDASTGVAYVGGGYEPNPGASNYAHPADDMGASGSAGVVAFPAGWPTGATPGTNVGPAPLCESCHTPHPAANIARTTITAASGTPILRDTEAALCARCHELGAAAGRHHPSNVPMDRMDDDVIGNADATLTCSDCHGGGAHNLGASGVTFDPQWEPTNNGRGLEAAERVTAGASKECEDCHYNAAGTPHLSPTNNQEDAGAAVTHAYRTDSPDYDDVGEGTHILGDATGGATWYDSGSVGGSAFDAIDDTWTAANGGGDGWSRFDGATGHVVCESCHELEPDKNVAGTALLLQFYSEGGTAAGDDPSGLCEGCHGVTPGGGSPHPMTGDNVAVTVGNPTGHTLNTTTAGVIRSPIVGNVTFPGANKMNCDSCHQPHDADSDSGTYILDSILTDVTATAGPTTDGETPANYLGSTATGLSFSTFCANCHDYL